MNTNSSSNQYLAEVLDSYAMRHVQEVANFYREVRNDVQKALEKHFGPHLAGKIVYSGSIAKATAINTHFDVDLIVPFKYKDIPHVHEVLDRMHAFLRGKFEHDDLDRVRLQRVSVGMNFYRSGFFSDVEFSMDIVPGRELQAGDYVQTQYLNLWDREAKATVQTNIDLQIEALRKSHDSVCKVIKLLKIWKYHGNGPKFAKSFYLEALTIRAFKQMGRDVPRGIWPQLRKVLEFMRDHLEATNLPDPGNKQNNLARYYNADTRKNLAGKVRNMLKAIDKDQDKIHQFFPLNEDFS